MTTLLVDLDGTLVDPAEGIIAAFRQALDASGVAAPPPGALRGIIGPPVRTSLAQWLTGRADVDRALAHYRAHYSDGGLFRARLYPGIIDALQRLRALPARLILCTSKPEIFASRVVDHFGLASFFDAIHGTDLDGTLDDKADLVAHIIARHGICPRRCVMIGDRRYDMQAASTNGVRSIGVLWGYGDRDELDRCRPTALCERPAELAEVVAGVVACATGCDAPPSPGNEA